ncbi:hypothetical protein [Breoghania sp.]|uniref:hypothetical protein n=1 Tax=Breoghania sp. TaxID=2065378 RepID=UPI00260D4D0E|nr:hypothetical protein [Breoghania sp.]MDJ0932497.1 hypothetical protein [Breoghania sp.]
MRKAMRSKTPDKDATRAAIAEVMTTYETGLAWRQKAEAPLEAYEAAIRDTIGLRLQPRLSEDQSLYVAACSSGHRDLSLSF